MLNLKSTPTMFELLKGTDIKLLSTARMGYIIRYANRSHAFETTLYCKNGFSKILERYETDVEATEGHKNWTEKFGMEYLCEPG
jgi:hypothetical protein